METYTIYADALDATRAALDRLMKKATRYGVPFTYTVGDEHPEIVRVYEADEITKIQYQVDKYVVAAVDITIDADALVKKDGWTVCAHVEHGNVGNIVTALNGESVNPDWFHVAAHCDHCNSNRFRKVTYFCRHESGEMRQVGSACLKDYTGINPAVVAMASEVRDILQEVTDCSPEDWEQTPHSEMYAVLAVIGLAVDEIERHGYRKSAVAGSTKGNVLEALKEGETPSESGAAKAGKIVEWLKAVDSEYNRIRDQIDAIEVARRAAEDEDNYFESNRLWRECGKLERALPGDVERNGSIIAASEYCKENHVGTLAYMPLAYDKAMERKAQAEKREAERGAQAAASEYVGQVKERLTIKAATAALVTSWETDYGVTYLYKFTDAAGNVFIWKASSKQDVSDGMTLKGTVKEHSERDGVKQTVLTRCKIAA